MTPSTTPKENSTNTTQRNDVCMPSNIPEKFLCPLTMQLMNEPVVDRFGRSYECSAIFRWIRENGSCPFSRQPMGPSSYIRNIPLKLDIEVWKKQNQLPGQSMEAHKHSSASDSDDATSCTDCEDFDEDNSLSDAMVFIVGCLPASDASTDTEDHAELATAAVRQDHRPAQDHADILLHGSAHRTESEVGRVMAQARAEQKRRQSQSLRRSQHASSSDTAEATATTATMSAKSRLKKVFQRQRRGGAKQ